MGHSARVDEFGYVANWPFPYSFRHIGYTLLAGVLKMYGDAGAEYLIACKTRSSHNCFSILRDTLECIRLNGYRVRILCSNPVGLSKGVFKELQKQRRIYEK